MFEQSLQSKGGSAVFVASELMNISDPLPDFEKTSANVPTCILHEIIKVVQSQTMINMR